MDISELTKGWVRFGGQIIDISKICYIVKGNYDKYTAYLSSGSSVQLPYGLVDLLEPYLQEFKTASTRTNEQGREVGGGPYITEQPRPLLGRVEGAVANDLRTGGAEFVELGNDLIIRRDQIRSLVIVDNGPDVSVTLLNGTEYIVSSAFWNQIKEALL